MGGRMRYGPVEHQFNSPAMTNPPRGQLGPAPEPPLGHAAARTQQERTMRMRSARSSGRSAGGGSAGAASAAAG